MANPGPELTNVILSGPSAQARSLKHSIEAAANSRHPVLIYGEPGAGKETAARLVHSRLKGGERFLTCYVGEETEGALLKLLDRYANLGPAAKANRDTLFLDGVNEMSSLAQQRLGLFLKSLEHKKNIHPKIIATSTEDLFGLVKYGAFSRDLFWRLNVSRVSIPSLRHRKADIPVIFGKLIKDAFSAAKAPKPSRPALEALTRYAWPGNLREMNNVVIRLKAQAVSGKLTRRQVTRLLANPLTTETGLGRGQNLSSAIYRNLEKYLRAHGADLPPSGLYDRILKEVERPLISLALSATRGNQIKAAELLGLNRNTLRKKIKNLGIQPKDLKS